MDIPFKFVMGYLLSVLGIVFGLILLFTADSTSSKDTKIVKQIFVSMLIVAGVVGVIVTYTEYDKYKKQHK